MRKSPTFSTKRTCKRCGNLYIPTGSAQIYCSECKPIIAKETKQKSYKKYNPNAYSPKEQKFCSVCGEKFACNLNGIPYCNKHYLKMKFYGTTESSRKSKNTYEIIDDYVKIKTTKGEIFLIDLDDLDKVLNYTWCLNKSGYVIANINHKITRLHRFILDYQSEKIIDHINGNPLDNRKANLRLCIPNQNGKNLKLKATNKIGYPGIRLTSFNKYNVRITVDKHEIHIGNFDTLQEAIEARKNAELKYYGEFAPSLGVLKD